MALVDTSAWVEFLRDTGSAVCEAVDRMITTDQVIATTDVVIMELLAGCATGDDRNKIWALMNRCRMFPTRPLLDYEKAAGLYSQCRSAGFQPRNTNDLLIAAVAIGKQTPILAAEADFVKIASVSTLELVG